MNLNQKQVARFWSHVDIKSKNECWEWKRSVAGKTGYGKVRFNDVWYLTHRISFLIIHGRFPEPCGLHKCDNKKCCNPNHIFEGTHKDNTQDMIKKGRRGIIKLTKEQARYVKNFVPKVKGDLSRLARSLGVGSTTISQIRAGRNWKNI